MNESPPVRPLTDPEKSFPDPFQVKLTGDHSDLEDDGSDLSDNFEEFHRNSFLRAYAVPGRKYLTKNEADWKTVEAHTEEFKKAMRDVRVELNLNNPIFDEFSEVEAALNTHRPIQITAKIGNEQFVEIEPDSASNSWTSEESKTWELLAANQTDTFQITSVGFNAFDVKQERLFQRPEIPWSTLNESRGKCEKWLNESFI